MKYNYVALVVLTTALLIIYAACRSDSRIDEHFLKPKAEFIIYGSNVQKMVNKPFKEIEKELGAITQVDKEVSIVFIGKVKDFVLKNQATQMKDRIDISYGPVDDLAIYERYKNILPNAVSFHGSFKISEKTEIKSNIIKQLERNLQKNDETAQVLDQIKNKFLMGNKEGVILKINFEMHDFSIANFVIGFSQAHQDEIFYKFTFSKTKNLYQ